MTDNLNQPQGQEPIQAEEQSKQAQVKANVQVKGQKASTSGMAVASLVLGIIAIVFSFLPLINLVSFIFVILGIIFGIVGIIGTGAGKKAGRGIAIAGLVVSAIACIITFVMYASAANTSETAVTEVIEETSQAASSSASTDSQESSAGSEATSSEAASSEASDGAVAGDTYEKATDSKYAVKIDSCKQTKDYSGKAAVKVTFTWTNNSDKAAPFFSSISTKAFQDGVELDTAILSGDSDSNISKEIKPGKSLKVTQAYKLDSTKEPVTIECSDLFSFNDALLAKKTFNLKK